MQCWCLFSMRGSCLFLSILVLVSSLFSGETCVLLTQSCAFTGDTCVVLCYVICMAILLCCLLRQVLCVYFTHWLLCCLSLLSDLFIMIMHFHMFGGRPFKPPVMATGADLMSSHAAHALLPSALLLIFGIPCCVLYCTCWYTVVPLRLVSLTLYVRPWSTGAVFRPVLHCRTTVPLFWCCLFLPASFSVTLFMFILVNVGYFPFWFGPYTFLTHFVIVFLVFVFGTLLQLWPSAITRNLFVLRHLGSVFILCLHCL